MILNQNQQSDAQLIGDIQNNKVGIDTNNLDFITSLLTTNLYSQPIQSFIRETVANGWDSHVEAGTTDKPVILRIYSDNQDNIHLAVRDYGTGLSPERFNEIYLNIGSSTKRASNQYIGAFGLGRWTMLAVSNICHLTNYYNGTCSKYIAYKDNAKICIDKVYEYATTEENGLEVDVNTEQHSNYGVYKDVKEGILQLTFYNNVYIDDTIGLVDQELNNFNDRKIADFKTFKVCDIISTNDCLLMGNVLYPIKKDIIDKWFRGAKSVPFAIKCNIGDVDVTPNREQLLYNQKTIDAINKCCQDALEEFRDICKTNFNSDFQTIKAYYEFVNQSWLYVTIKKFDNHEKSLSIPVSELSYYGLSKNVTICGKVPSPKLKSFYENFIHMRIPYSTILYCYHNNRFYVKDNTLDIFRYIDYYNTGHIYLVDEPLAPIAKKYFTKCVRPYRNYYFLYKKHLHLAFLKIVKAFCKAYTESPTHPDIKFIYQDFIKNYTNIKTYSIKDVPQSFIDDEKAKTKSTKSTTQQKARKCVIYRLIQGRKFHSIGYDSSETSEELKKYKGTVFFAEKGNPYLEMFYRILEATSSFNNRIMLVEVAPSNLPILRELKNTIEFNSVFTEKNNIISKICTYVYLLEKWCRTNMSYYCGDYKLINKESSSNNILNRIKWYNRYLLETPADNELLKLLCKTYFEKGWLNYRIINTLESNIDYIKLDYIFGKNSELDNKNVIVAFYEYIIKDNINQQRLKLIKETLKPLLNEYTPNQKLPHFDIG